jgi:uncharacterized protein YjiS (DUF1127 family)
MTPDTRERDNLARRGFAPASVAAAGHGAAVALPSLAALPRTGVTSAVLHAFVRAVATVWAWHDRTRQRRTLRELSNHMLRDIGLDRGAALAEATKPFWRA